MIFSIFLCGEPPGLHFLFIFLIDQMVHPMKKDQLTDLYSTLSTTIYSSSLDSSSVLLGHMNVTKANQISETSIVRATTSIDIKTFLIEPSFLHSSPLPSLIPCLVLDRTSVVKTLPLPLRNSEYRSTLLYSNSSVHKTPVTFSIISTTQSSGIKTSNDFINRTLLPSYHSLQKRQFVNLTQGLDVSRAIDTTQSPDKVSVTWSSVKNLENVSECCGMTKDIITPTLGFKHVKTSTKLEVLEEQFDERRSGITEGNCFDNIIYPEYSRVPNRRGWGLLINF